MIDDLEHRIRERAHSIWEQEGRPAGRAEAHWAMASAELGAASKPKPRRRAAAADSTVASLAAKPAPKRPKAAARTA
jgi:hypothetical protein